MHDTMEQRECESIGVIQQLRESVGETSSYSGNSQEWNAFKFVFKSYIGVVAHPMLAAMNHAET